jgi:TolA-binding protein
MCKLNLVTAALGMMLLVGCQQQASKMELEEKTPSSVTMDDVMRDAAASMNTIAEYSQQEKEKFLITMKEQLEIMDAKIEDLRLKGEGLVGEAKLRWEKRMASLDDKRKSAADKLEEIGESTSRAWDEVKQGVETAWEELTSAFQEAGREF